MDAHEGPGKLLLEIRQALVQHQLPGGPAGGDVLVLGDEIADGIDRNQFEAAEARGAQMCAPCENVPSLVEPQQPGVVEDIGPL